MTVTGLTKVLEDISDAIYEDFLMILPWSVLFTILVITALHQVGEGRRHHGNADHDGSGHHLWFIGHHGHHPHADDRCDVPHFDRTGG